MVRDWDRQRKQWFKGSKCNCSGWACAAGGASWQNASKSFSALRAFVHAPCGKQSFDELRIESGPKSTEKVEFYARQCCRVPLPNDFVPSGLEEEERVYLVSSGQLISSAYLADKALWLPLHTQSSLSEQAVGSRSRTRRYVGTASGAASKLGHQCITFPTPRRSARCVINAAGT